MNQRLRFLPGVFLFFSSLLILNPTHAQGQAQTRVVEAVDDAKRVTLPGNVHPLARAEFDRGAAPDALPMTRILLLLKRSDAQEAALQDYLEKQQDKSSPNYHQWLTPQEFGAQYGPADADIQAVTQWLASQGFTVEKVYSGKTVIEFSGTAAQVRAAFGTEIHNYQVEGKTYTANASDPQIPTALAPVVAGIVSLNSFPRQAMYRAVGVFTRSKETGKAKLTQPEHPELTFPCGMNSNTGQAIYCNAVVPYDFATIYNVLPLWTAATPIDGTGQTIAIVGESNINLDDVRNFRSSFGLASNDPVIVLNGPDPGLVQGAETEADLDVEWSGAVAKGATIKLVVSQSTEASSGADLSAVYVVDNNLAPVMSMSFGNCELYLGTTGNRFFNNLWEQAAAQGISVFVSSGDNGSAGCDFNQGTVPQPANNGLQVSGIASTPFNIAVGGTDFSDVFTETTYWSITNDPTTQKSALSYIPETTWNDSCTNALFGDSRIGFSTNPETNCNNSQLTNWVFTIGGSGGQSNCTTPSGQTPGSCAGGNPKPAWQMGVGVPLNGGRAVPDVSLLSGDGFAGNAYAVCEEDKVAGPCTSTFLGVGGTSASSPAFAGIMALVNQKTQSRQGSANVVFYKLAAKQTPSSCNSSTGSGSTCVFNDVTSGTIAMPCTKGSLNCTTSNQSHQYGILSGYSAGAGYDLATGLGSVNVQNLVNNWSSITFLSSATTLSASVNGSPVSSISVAHGATVGVTSDVSAGTGTTGTPTGQVALMATPNPTPANPSGPLSASLGIQALTLSSGAASSTSVILPGGSYTLTAHYQGDAAFGSSDSSGIPVSITAETSKTLISIPTFDSTTGRETGNTPTSIVYGSLYLGRIDVGNAQAALSYPAKPVCTPPSCPTGTITWTDAFNGGAATPLDGGTFALNSEGYTEDVMIQLPGGTHSLSASYSGDNSYKPGSSTYSLNVTPAPMSITFSPNGNPVTGIPWQAYVGASATTPTGGVAPTGTLTLYDGANVLGNPITIAGNGGASPGFSFELAFTLTTGGDHPLSVKYSGDSNYAPASSATQTVHALIATTMNLQASATTVSYGTSITVTATLSTGQKSPPITGQIPFGSGNLDPINVGPTTQGTDASGNLTLQATATLTPQISEWISAGYNGDANYGAAPVSYIGVAVNIPDFSMGPTGGVSVVPVAGQPGSGQITIAPVSQTPSTVNLSLWPVVIPGYTIALSPQQVSLNGSAATATISLTPTVSVPSNAIRGQTRHAGGFAIKRGNWWRLSLATGLGGLFLLGLPGRRKRLRAALGLSAACLLCLALGCGGGGAGGGGGGTPQRQPTSIALTTSNAKAGMNDQFTITATVTGTESLTGTISFYDYRTQIFAGDIPVFNGQVQATNYGYVYGLGIHQFLAKYNGDTNNLPSTSSVLTQVVTGTMPVTIQGATGGDVHTLQVTLGVQ